MLPPVPETVCWFVFCVSIGLFQSLKKKRERKVRWKIQRNSPVGGFLDLPCVHRISPCVFAPEEEKEEVGSKVTDALGENFEKHDKIAKIHQGAVNGGLPAFYVACKLIIDALFR